MEKEKDFTQETFNEQEKQMLQLTKSINRRFLRPITIQELCQHSQYTFERAQSIIEALMLYGFAFPKIENNKNKFIFGTGRDFRINNLKSQIETYEKLIAAYQIKKTVIERLIVFTENKKEEEEK